jgi:hypothetical protein
MPRLTAQLIDDASVLAHACREILWEVADLAEDVRSQMKSRRDLARIAEREQGLYEQIGRTAHALLSDGVSIERTPDFSAMLADLSRLASQRRNRMRVPDSAHIPLSPSVSVRRLTRALQAGDWRVHTVALEASSPWIGKTLDRDPPAGFCLAVQREHTLFPYSADWTFQQADLLLVLAPVSDLELWDNWIAQGSTNLVGEL